jgi:prolyl-tRNA synthetase
MPPKIATNQIDIIEIFGNKSEKVRNIVNNLEKVLKRTYRVRVDRSNKGPGFKAAKSEIQGAPLRIEVGPRDVDNDQIILIKRNTLEKITINLSEVKLNVKNILNDIQSELYSDAKNRLEENIVYAKSYDEFKKLINEKKFVIIHFAGNTSDEIKIQKETGATARCIPFKILDKRLGKCLITSKNTKRQVLFAKAY